MKVKCVKVGRYYSSSFKQGKIYDINPETGYFEYENNKSTTSIILNRFVNGKLKEYNSDWELIDENSNNQYIEIY